MHVDRPHPFGFRGRDAPKVDDFDTARLHDLPRDPVVEQRIAEIAVGADSARRDGGRRDEEQLGPGRLQLFDDLKQVCAVGFWVRLRRVRGLSGRDDLAGRVAGFTLHVVQPEVERDHVRFADTADPAFDVGQAILGPRTIHRLPVGCRRPHDLRDRLQVFGQRRGVTDRDRIAQDQHGRQRGLGRLIRCHGRLGIRRVSGAKRTLR